MNFGCRFEPVKAEAAFGIGDLGVGETLDDQAVVVAEVGVGDRGDVGDDLVHLHLVEEALDQRVRHRLVDVLDVHQPPDRRWSRGRRSGCGSSSSRNCGHAGSA
jgi:hypothetical protein